MAPPRGSRRDDPGAGETTPPRPLLVVALAGAAARSLVEEVRDGVYRLTLEVGTFTSLPLGAAHTTCPTCGEYDLESFYKKLLDRQKEQPSPLEAFCINAPVAPEEALATLASAAERLLADEKVPTIRCVACVVAALVTPVAPLSRTAVALSAVTILIQTHRYTERSWADGSHAQQRSSGPKRSSTPTGRGAGSATRSCSRRSTAARASPATTCS